MSRLDEAFRVPTRIVDVEVDRARFEAGARQHQAEDEYPREVEYVCALHLELYVCSFLLEDTS